MHKKGAAILISVIIVGAIVLLVSVGMAAANRSFKAYTENYEEIIPLNINLDGCVEEALIRLNRDNDYEGENIMMEETVCDITVYSDLDQRNIIVLATKGDYKKQKEIDVSLTPSFAITAWRE